MLKKSLNKNLSSGFTVVEMLVVLGLVIVLSSIGLQSFQTLNTNESLNKDALQVLSVLRQARAFTLASKNADQYGVHFEATRVVLFDGDTYNSSDPANIETVLNTRVGISTISLATTTTDLVFDPLTGKTSEDGTVTLYSKKSPTTTRVITIYKTGIAQIN